MIKLDILLQGPCSGPTENIIKEYRKLDFCGDIFLSTYENTICFDVPSYVTVINNTGLENPGIGNRNLQIKTSRSGMKLVNSDYSVKMRTDQFIRPESMSLMNEYWSKNRNSEGLLFVMGMYLLFPYHPRDHVFWGETRYIRELFEIPYDTDIEPTRLSYDDHLRAETYIGQYYYARFDSDIYEHISNPMRYLVDSAPLKVEALQKDLSLRDRVFKPFPRVSMQWEKHGLNEYHYHVGASFSEYWAN